MRTWFTCKIKYQKEDDKGHLKNVTEPYLVDAVNYTEAEARIYEELGSIIRGEFSVNSITKANIADIFHFEDSDQWYKCKAIYYVEDDNGNEKKITNYMLVTANDVKDAFERLHDSLKGVLVTFKITDVGESPIVEIFPYFAEEDKFQDNGEKAKAQEIAASNSQFYAVDDDEEEEEIEEEEVVENEDLEEDVEEDSTEEI